MSEVSAAVLWGGPPLDDSSRTAWRNDQSVAELVRFITAQASPVEDIESRVAAFARVPADGHRNRKLTLAFAGSLEVMNKRRFRFLQGILKFSRQQIMRARIINDGLARLTDLKATGDSTEARQTLERKLIWQQRIFDDRERSIRFLCEQPIDVEVALGDLARMLSNELD